MNIIENKRA